MSTTTTSNLSESMFRIHRAISRALNVAVQVNKSKGPAIELRPGFQLYLQALAAVLHAHHVSEDEVLFPFWRGVEPQAPIDTLIHHHRSIIPYLKDIHGWVALGLEGWKPDSISQLGTTIDGLNQLWHNHITLEESVFSVGQVVKLLSAEDGEELNTQLAAQSQQHAQPAELVIPFVLYNLEGEDREAMKVAFPPVVIEQMIPITWKPAWQPMQPFLLD